MRNEMLRLWLGIYRAYYSPGCLVLRNRDLTANTCEGSDFIPIASIATRNAPCTATFQFHMQIIAGHQVGLGIVEMEILDSAVR